MKKYPLIKGSYAYAIALYGTDGFNTEQLKAGELEISGIWAMFNINITLFKKKANVA